MSAIAGFEVVGVPPNVAASLTALVDSDGSLAREDVVAAARPESSPLHNYFEWSDSKAAEAWRLEQASQLIRRVQVKVIPAPESPPIRVRAWISNADLPHESESDVRAGSYRSIEAVVSRGTTFEESLADSIRRDLLRLQVKYSSAELFFKVMREQLEDGEQV